MFASVTTAIIGGLLKLIHDVGTLKTLIEIDDVLRTNIVADVADVCRSTKRAHERIDQNHDVTLDQGHRIVALERWRDSGNPEGRTRG
jgi:hypothetical protein